MRDADLEIELILDEGEPSWVVGLARLERTAWYAVHADHSPHADMDPAARRELTEHLDVALVGASAVWEGEDGDRRDTDPVQAWEWYATLPADGWRELVEGVYRLSAPEPWDWAVQRLRRVPAFAVEVAVARAYRVPYTQFLAWSEDDRAIAVAALVEERATCPGCGVAARAMRDYDAAEVAVQVCVWCGMLAQARRDATTEEHPGIRLREGR